MAEPQGCHAARFGVDREIGFRFEVCGFRSSEKARFRRVGGFDVRIREVRFSRFAGDGADRLHEHPLGEFLRKIRLVEPHHLDGTGGVGDDRFAHGNFSLP